MKYTPEEMEAKGWLDNPEPEQKPQEAPKPPQNAPKEPEKADEEIMPKSTLYTQPKTALNLFKKNNQEINRLKKKIRERDFVIRKLMNDILKRLDE